MSYIKGQAHYNVGINDIPAHFVTPIAYAIRRWVEDKSEWKDEDDISKLVDRLIFFKKIDEKDDKDKRKVVD